MVLYIFLASETSLPNYSWALQHNPMKDVQDAAWKATPQTMH